jgi:predicted transcriptional regulator YdeE
MKQLKNIDSPINIVGVELRTSNDNGRAFEEIPPFWEKFYTNAVSDMISNKKSMDVFSLYTNFENQGKNNQGMYSMIIGHEVESLEDLPSGFVGFTIPTSGYLVFPVEDGKVENVIKTWETIWNIPADDKKEWTFTCEFERYKSDGEIEVYIGTKVHE